MRCASVKSLMAIHHVDEQIAKLVRAVWRAKSRDEIIAACPESADYGRDFYARPTLRACKRDAVNRLIGAHGVEYLGVSRKTGEDVYYCNAGDAYVATVIFAGDTLRVGCWADMVERGSIREKQLW